MVQEELRVQHLVPMANRRRQTPQAGRRRVSKPTPAVTHFLQQGHIYSTRLNLLIAPFPDQAYSNHHTPHLILSTNLSFNLPLHSPTYLPIFSLTSILTTSPRSQQSNGKAASVTHCLTTGLIACTAQDLVLTMGDNFHFPPPDSISNRVSTNVIP